MNPPRIDPDRLKEERHDADLGTTETAFGHVRPAAPDEDDAQKGVLEEATAPLPNPD